MKYYALCGFGGILSCGLTHTAVVPLDLVKCRIQVRVFDNLWLYYHTNAGVGETVVYVLSIDPE